MKKMFVLYFIGIVLSLAGWTLDDLPLSIIGCFLLNFSISSLLYDEIFEMRLRIEELESELNYASTENQ